MIAQRDPPKEPEDAGATRRAERERARREQAAAELEIQRTRWLRALRRATTRATRKLAAIEGDVQRAQEVGALRRHASLLLTHLHALPRATTDITLLDESFDPPESVALHIDPQLGPKRQADAWFVRARKLERGVVIAEARAASTRGVLRALADLEHQIAAAATPEDLEPLRAVARNLGLAIDQGGGTTANDKPAQRVPYREFEGSGSRRILVGKGKDDNDRLTLDHAKPRDLWLHTRDEAGAHVVVPLDRDEACPPELLADAATLAAHFSQARGQSPVEVIYTPRRYVRKPRGSGPGRVALLREKVFLLRLDSERLKRLLAAERPSAR